MISFLSTVLEYEQIRPFVRLFSCNRVWLYFVRLLISSVRYYNFLFNFVQYLPETSRLGRPTKLWNKWWVIVMRQNEIAITVNSYGWKEAKIPFFSLVFASELVTSVTFCDWTMTRRQEQVKRNNVTKVSKKTQ